MNRISGIGLPTLNKAEVLRNGATRCYIGAYGFEERVLGWTLIQAKQGEIVNKAFVFKYINGNPKNRIDELKRKLESIGIRADSIVDLHYDVLFPYDIEDKFDSILKDISTFDEIILDVTGMTKFLILISLKLSTLSKKVRVVYAEAMQYAPSKSDFAKSKNAMTVLAKFPNRGFGSIIRARCLGSIRMQGQPVTLIAFASFNEQLIRHMLGTISPHRLIFINGRPPREEFRWRESATQQIHGKLIEEFAADNPVDSKGQLLNVTSTLFYQETLVRIDEIYGTFGLHERIMVAATGSKMQTVGLFFAKILHPDIHIEYPAPQSYFEKGLSQHVRQVHEILIDDFSALIANLQSYEGRCLTL